MQVTGRGDAHGLRERDVEIAALRHHVGAAMAGAGRAVTVEGSAGLGKTRLLEIVRAVAEREGSTVLAARGGEHETDFAFGAVHQLFDHLLVRADDERRSVLLHGAASLAKPLLWPDDGAVVTEWGARDVSSATSHGLHWLIANLADESPLVLIVDDAQWLDPASAAWLEYLAKRLADLPVLVVLGVRTGEPDSAFPEALLSEIAMERIELRPLRATTTAALVRRALESRASPELCAECHRATAGNPFLLSELLHALQSDVRDGVPVLRVSEVTPRAVSVFVLSRLARIGSDAANLARAVAILGDGAPLHRAGRLADLDESSTVDAADALVRAEILTPSPLGFVHPLLRAAVYQDIAPARRSQAHGRAARLLAEAHGDSAAIAAHLLQSEPSADPDVVMLLRDAARAAAAAGAPQMATAYLERCLAEPPPAGVVNEVVRELAFAEAHAGAPGAVEHMHVALEGAAKMEDRARIALQLGEALINAGRTDDAYDVLTQAIDHEVFHDDDLAIRLETWRANIGLWDPRFAGATESRHEVLEEMAGRATPSARLALLLVAYRAGLKGASHEEVIALLDRGLDGGALIADEGAAGWPMGCAINVLNWFDDLVRLDGLQVAMREDAARRGSPVALISATAAALYIASRQGDMRALDSEARTLLEITAQHPFPFWEAVADGYVADACLERGDVERAVDIFAGIDVRLARGTAPGAVLVFNRGRIRAASGDVTGAIADLREALEIAVTLGSAHPMTFPWRSELARHLATTDPDEARALIEEDLVLARACGVPRAIGVSLRTAALLETPAPLELLEEAVEMLARSPARLEHARALVDLGAALRRRGNDVDARRPLTEGMELAERCGSVILARRAREELTAAGARPRRARTSGPDSLTPSERRIAEMAAAGLTSKDIAQALFLSTRTVGSHLARIYPKLGITSRKQLADALAEGQLET